MPFTFKSILVFGFLPGIVLVSFVLFAALFVLAGSGVNNVMASLFFHAE